MKTSKTKFLIILAVGVALLWGGSYLFLPGSGAQQEIKTEELEHQPTPVVVTAPGYTPPGPVEKPPIITEDSRRPQRQTNVVHTPTPSAKALLTEDFEGGVIPPTGWSVVVNNPYTWEIDSYNPYEGYYYASCFYDETYSGTQDEWLISPVIDLTTKGEAWHLYFFWMMSYYWGVDPYDNYELEVWISTDGGANFTTKLWCEDDVGLFETFVWYMADVDLAAYLTETDVKLGFRYYGYDGAQASLDFINVDAALIGRCCYGDPYAPDCADVTEEECDGLGGTWDYGLNCTDDPCPVLTPGDDCDDPMVVNLPADMPYTDAGQKTCDRGNDYDATCLGYYDGGEDMIYQVNVTSAVDVDIMLYPKGTTYTGIAIDNACPPGATCIDYSTTSGGGSHGITGLHLDPGTYYIMVDTWPSPDCIPDFDLTITQMAGPPPNDDCGNAQAVGDVTDLAFSTTNASFDGLGDCMYSPNIWYCYTATCNGLATVSLCGSGYDTKLAVYEGCVCDPLGTEIECNDDFCGVQSEISFTAVQDNEYLIEVGGYSTNTGDGILNISCAPPPPNDECTGAYATSTFPWTFYGTTNGATIDCPGVLDWNAVWYEFVLPYAYNDVFIDFCPTVDDIGEVGIILYDECPPDCPNYISCYPNYQWVNCPNGSYNPQMWWDKLPGPKSYWFPVYVVPGKKGMDFGFEVSVTEAEPPPNGSSCDLPIEVELPLDLPYMDREQTTCGMGDDYDNTCLGYYDGGEDIIYKLEVTEAVSVMITFDPKGTTWNGIALDDDCPLDPSTCLYTYTQSGGSMHQFQYDLGVGTYYIMIDTWPSPDCIPDFDLTIDPLGPEISVEPDNFYQELNPDGTADDHMYITNEGYADLDYEVTEDPEVGWLSCAPTSGTVLPGLTDDVTVSFDATGLGVGDYYTTLVVASNSLKQLEDTVLVPVHLVVELPPDIDVVPPAVSMGVVPGCSMGKGVDVHNYGPGELRFEVAVQQAPPLKQADVLLVDDDHSAVFPGDFTDVVSYFTDALDANGYTYDIVEITVEGGDGPDAATMADYPVVIWFTGESWRYEQTLTPTDEVELATYLDGGGNLFLSAMDYFYDRYSSAGSFSQGQFPYDYLGVTYVDQDAWWLTNPESGTATGMTGSLAEGMEFTLYDVYTPPPGGKDGLCIDIITHMGIDLFEITDPTPPTGVVACQYEVAKGFKVVFTTVDFAGLVDGTSPSTRAELMGNIMDWFLGAGCPFTVSPEADTVDPGESSEVVITFDGNAFEECVDETLTCYLVFSSNDPDEPEVAVEVDMWAGRGDVFDPECLIDLGDVVFLINFVFRSGPAPAPMCAGDCNPSHDGLVDIEDVMYLIQYLYQGGMPPLAKPEIPRPGTIK